MSDIMDKVRTVVTKNTDVDSRIENILVRNFGLDDKDADAGFKAYGYMAVQVGVALSNMFLALKNPDQGRSYRAFCDLTYQLSTNEFWQKNASVILPIVHVALNSYRDKVALQVEQANGQEYGTNDAIIAAAQAAPLELFPLLAYLIGGPGLMVQASIPLKTELAPYFL